MSTKKGAKETNAVFRGCTQFYIFSNLVNSMQSAQCDSDYFVFFDIDAHSGGNQVSADLLKRTAAQVHMLCYLLKALAHLGGIWQGGQSRLSVHKCLVSRRDLLSQCSGSSARRLCVNYAIGGKVGQPVLLYLDRRDLRLDCLYFLFNRSAARSHFPKRRVYAARLLQFCLDDLLQRLYNDTLAYQVIVARLRLTVGIMAVAAEIAPASALE